MITSKEFLEKAISISGYLKENQGILYANYTLPGMENCKGLWDIYERIKRLKLDVDLHGKEILEIGSNTGAMSFALAQRGANITGIEINKERVDLCNKIAHHYNLNCSFENIDVENLPDHILDKKYDIVLCTRIDAYIKSLSLLFQDLSIMTKDLCVYESNRIDENQDLIKDMLKYYFHSIKTIENIKFKTGVVSNIYKLERPISPYCWHKKSYKLNDFWVKETSQKNWLRVKNIFASLPPCKYIPEIKFSEPNLILTKDIKENNFYEKMKSSYRLQIIDFLKFMSENKVCHRDLHWGNFIFDENQIWFIDWELLHHCNIENIEDHYDISGKNQITPQGFDEPRTIFTKINNQKSIAEYFDIKIKDIKK